MPNAAPHGTPLPSTAAQRLHGGRPLRALLLAGFCAATTVFLVVRDLFLPEVRDVEVWFGLELRGPWAIATAPLHWLIFALAARAFWRGDAWIWPCASLYAFGIALSHLIWNQTSPNGGGLEAGLVQLVAFSIPALALLALRPRGGAA